MTIVKITNWCLEGLAADTKPTIYASGTLFFETDTGSIYMYNGTTWNLYRAASKTETLTNKTINATNNTITDTSAAVGDILAISSGSTFKRLAMGTSNQVLAVNAGGTAIGWATNSGSGAPTSSPYVTISSDATLTAERSLAVGSGLTLTDGGANSTVTLDNPVTSIAKNRISYYDDNLIYGYGFSSNGTCTGTGCTWGGVTTDVNTGAYGEILLNPGTTATGATIVYTNDKALLTGLGTLTIEYRIIVPVLSTGTQTFIVRAGLGDTASANADQVNGVYFEYDQSTSTFWKMCAAGASTRTKTASAQAATTSYARLKIVINTAGTSATYFYNDTSLGTVSTNLPATSVKLMMFIQIVKTVGTTATLIYNDYVALNYDLTSSR